jgi:DNA-binding NarL/FixJ family response regulator
MIDCRRAGSETGCTLTIVGCEDEVLDAAAEHAVARHGQQDTPQLRETIRARLEDAAPPGWLSRELGTAADSGGDSQAATALLQSHVAEAQRRQGRRAAARPLTGRQRELLRMVAAGHDNIAIARQLGVSPGTVRKHLENAFARLGVSSRTAAIAKLYPDITWR